MASQDWKPLPRCCRTHDDYATLIDHLNNDFPELTARDVAEQVVAAKQAVATFGITGRDGVNTVELICRYQLSVIAGRFDDAARLDPQQHPSRKEPAA